MIERIIETLLVLLFCHALADFVLQTDVMAKLKVRTNDIKRKKQWEFEEIVGMKKRTIIIPPGQKYQLTWFYWLLAHALIQGGLIWIFFQSWELMLIETIAHFSIDYLKCASKTNIHQDQGMHLSLRVLYCCVIVGGLI